MGVTCRRPPSIISPPGRHSPYPPLTPDRSGLWVVVGMHQQLIDAPSTLASHLRRDRRRDPSTCCFLVLYHARILIPSSICTFMPVPVCPGTSVVTATHFPPNEFLLASSELMNNATSSTSSTYHPLVDPAMEVWGARLTSYLGAVGMVIMHYDCLLTLKHEVCPIFRAFGHPSYPFRIPQIRLVWPGTLSFPNVLYYLNRYLPIVAIIFCNYGQWDVFPSRSLRH
jgi:hypothetical protein